MKKQSKSFLSWSISFLKKVVVVVTIAWIFQLIYSAIMILYAVNVCGDFSYLDTFISDNGETFRLIVGTGIVAKTVENIFKYNNGGIFGTSLTVPEINEVTSDGDIAG